MFNIAELSSRSNSRYIQTQRVGLVVALSVSLSDPFFLLLLGSGFKGTLTIVICIPQFDYREHISGLILFKLYVDLLYFFVCML